jgi:DnaJ-domain-containing protein 1
MKAALPRDRLFARTLCTAEERGSSGIVTAQRGKLRRLFCVENGWIVFATSNLIEEQFVEYLVRSGALSPSARTDAIDDAARTGRKVTEILAASGRPPSSVLRGGMEGLVSELFSSTLEWPDGASAFAPGLPRLDGEVTVRVSARSLVLAHVRRYPATVDALRVRIGPPDFRPVAADVIPDGWEIDPLGDYLLRRADGTVELAALVLDSPADEERTLRLLYGFLLLGLLEPEAATSRQARNKGPGEAELTREECLGRLSLSAGSDHYAVLGIDRGARRDAVRNAYYALARRYHPDRFRSGPLADLLPRFEEFFTHVTDAYNTLFDPERRADYDQQAAATAGDADAKGPDTGYLARQNFLRGRALAAHKKFTEAVTFLENAVQLDPAQAEYHLELGLVLAGNPRHREDAERHLLKAVTLSPSLVAGYVALSSMYVKAGRPGRGARMAREALRWEPGNAEASTLLAEAGNAPDENEDDAFRSVFGRP